jgi:hypothetical protein
MVTHHESQPQPRQVVSRLGLYLPPALLIAVALAWCGFWFYSANITEKKLANLKADEAAKGRQWDCADQKIGGFPFRIEVYCSSVTLSAMAEGRPARLSAGALHAATQIYSPSLLLADLDGPLIVASEGADTKIAWESLRVSARFSDRLDRLSVAMTKPQVELTPSSGEKNASAAKYAEAHLRYDAGRAVDERAVDLALQLNEVSSPVADNLFGSSDKLDLAIAGVVTKLSDLPARGWRNLLESWRNAGGDLRIESGKLTKGTLQIDAKGALNLDSLHRPQGKLDLSAKGIGPLVARFGGGGMSQMIGPLLTRKDGAPMQWPMQLQDGRIQIGPLRTGPVLGALY